MKTTLGVLLVSLGAVGIFLGSPGSKQAIPNPGIEMNINEEIHASHYPVRVGTNAMGRLLYEFEFNPPLTNGYQVLGRDFNQESWIVEGTSTNRTTIRQFALQNQARGGLPVKHYKIVSPPIPLPK